MLLTKPVRSPLTIKLTPQKYLIFQKLIQKCMHTMNFLLKTNSILRKNLYITLLFRVYYQRVLMKKSRVAKDNENFIDFGEIALI